MTWRIRKNWLTIGCTGSPKKPAPGEPHVMEKLMKECLLVFVIFSLFTTQIRADCGHSPGWELDRKEVTEYHHAKTVYYPTEGNMQTHDTLCVWNKDDKGLCFSIETYTSYFHNCGLVARATKVKRNEYSYAQKDCRLILTFLKDKVEVSVKGPRGNYCVDDDLVGGGCGINASIGSATYIRAKKVNP